MMIKKEKIVLRNELFQILFENDFLVYIKKINTYKIKNLNKLLQFLDQNFFIKR